MCDMRAEGTGREGKKRVGEGKDRTPNEGSGTQGGIRSTTW